MDRHAFGTITSSLLDAGLSVRFRAGGHSMGSAVRDGEHVTVAPVDAVNVEIGDVVLGQTWRGPIAHRVQRISRDATGAVRFVLRGDASLEDDRAISGAQLQGRLVSVEREGRTFELAVRGGALGKRLFVEALRFRTALVARTRAALAGQLAPSP